MNFQGNIWLVAMQFQLWQSTFMQMSYLGLSENFSNNFSNEHICGTVSIWIKMCLNEVYPPKPITETLDLCVKYALNWQQTHDNDVLLGLDGRTKKLKTELFQFAFPSLLLWQISYHKKFLERKEFRSFNIGLSGIIKNFILRSYANDACLMMDVFSSLHAPCSVCLFLAPWIDVTSTLAAY